MYRSVRIKCTAPELRGEWRRRSDASGWAFPSDWYVPAVDAVCEALCGDLSTLRPAAERLGHQRANGGVPLAEALLDADAVAGLVPDCAEDLRRAVSLGWADRAAAPTDSVTDALTGLVSADYLRVRLGEVYRAAEVEGSSAAVTHALVVIRLGGPEGVQWAHSLPMILVGDLMRTVFAGGQSLARIGGMVAVVLTERTPTLARRARLLAEMLATRVRLEQEPELLPQVWIENLPPGLDAAHAMLADLAR